MAEGAERREWLEKASVVNSRTWDGFSPHKGDFFEGYGWLRFDRVNNRPTGWVIGHT
jgi:hypothetical protein